MAAPRVAAIRQQLGWDALRDVVGSLNGTDGIELSREQQGRASDDAKGR